MSSELHLAMTETTLAAIERVLFPSTAAAAPPERGLIALVTRSTGVRRTTLLVRNVIEPRPRDVEWSDVDGLLFSTAYKSRAIDAANAIGAGVLFVHTHPTSRPPMPSPEDLEADRRDLFHLGQALVGGGVLAAAVVNESRAWSAREYFFEYPRTAAEAASPRHSAAAGKMRFVSTMRVVGPSLRLRTLHPSQELESLDVHAQDSTILLWGAEGQARLGRLRVAIIGLGGVGGILAEHVARLGVGELLLIDFDRLKLANKNRSQGATPAELDRGVLKVDVGERLARDGATAPGFAVTSVRGSIVERGTVQNVLDCDVVLNAADSPWARQVLDHLAFAHLIPVISGGSELRGDPETLLLVAAKSEVAVAAPGHPCFECAGVYAISDASKAREHPSVRGERAYAKVGDQVPASLRSPSMISTNALVAGLMQLRLQALALGTTPAAVLGTQRYHPLEGNADLALRTVCRSACTRIETSALGDLHDLPLGVDRDFEVAREEDEATRAQNAETDTPKSSGTTEETWAMSGGSAGS